MCCSKMCYMQVVWRWLSGIDLIILILAETCSQSSYQLLHVTYIVFINIIAVDIGF